MARFNRYSLDNDHPIVQRLILDYKWIYTYQCPIPSAAEVANLRDSYRRRPKFQLKRLFQAYRQHLSGFGNRGDPTYLPALLALVLAINSQQREPIDKKVFLIGAPLYWWLTNVQTCEWWLVGIIVMLVALWRLKPMEKDQQKKH